MPPDKAVRPFVSLQVNWIGVIDLGNFPYISRDKKKIGDARKENEYWPNFAALQKWNISLYRRNKNDFKKLTTEVIGDAATDEEKVRRIYEFCRTKVNNTSYGYELTQKELKKYNAGEWRRIEPGSFSKRTPFGSVHDIRLLFGTMLSAAGIEPWQVFTSRRDEIFFKPEMNDAQFLSSAGIGVMIDGTLKVLDPGQKFQPFGMLSWPREGSVALFTNGEDFGWRQLPISSYEQNRIKRHGRFRLLDDGTLIGEVTIELTGQPALTYRLDHYKDAVPQLEKDLIDSIRARITNAELAHISVENINDIYAPLVQKFSIKVPQYAQRTGTRMIFQPGVFEFGTTPAFSSPRRKYDIFFRYPWSETDDIEIEIPKGFSPDNAESPGEVTASGGISRDKITMSFSPSRSTLVYHRNFFFGGNDAVLFPQASYEGVKTLWDRIHRADTAGFVVRNNN
ncbi:MAG: transglutaminase domain-containing protein [Acidobacteria bacterium OLB17]|nr:MAG: transglutaminase domain-containing protein [Acidobacteria bacterium OLB17]